jgi:hypothetical protein
MLAINLLLTAVAGVPLALIAAAGVDGAPLLVAGACLFALSYVGILLATRRLDARETELIRRAPRELGMTLGHLWPGQPHRSPR